MKKKPFDKIWVRILVSLISAMIIYVGFLSIYALSLGVEIGFHYWLRYTLIETIDYVSRWILPIIFSLGIFWGFIRYVYWWVLPLFFSIVFMWSFFQVLAEKPDRSNLWPVTLLVHITILFALAFGSWVGKLLSNYFQNKSKPKTN